MPKVAEGTYISALGEIRKRILGDDEKLELLEPLCRDICSIEDAEYTAVTAAALNVATEVFLELFARYPKVTAGMALVTAPAARGTEHLTAAKEALSLSGNELYILKQATYFRLLLCKHAETSTSGKLCKAAVYNLFETFRAEALIEAHQEPAIILSKSTPWKTTEDDSIGLFPLESYVVFIRYLVRSDAPATPSDNFSKTFLSVLSDYTDVCFFSLLALDTIIREVQAEIHSATGIGKLSISPHAAIAFYQLFLQAAQALVKKDTSEYYIEYIATSVACIKGCARSSTIPGITGLLDVVLNTEAKVEQKRLKSGLLEKASLLIETLAINAKKQEEAEMRGKKVQSMNKHNRSQLYLLLEEAQRIERENKAPPEVELVVPAYALENAEGLKAVIFSCYYSICECLFVLACSTVAHSTAPAHFVSLHNKIIAILSISDQAIQHISSSSQSICLIETMKKFFNLQQSIERITACRLPANHHIKRFALAYKLMAIDSIFKLCTINNMPLNKFFESFFSLLVPEIFSITGCRVRILQLLAKCMRTSYVSTAIQACFLKRLAILALSVSANVTLSIVLLIIATLKRHSNLKWLLKTVEGDSPADTSVFYKLPLSLPSCLELWEGISAPSISLVELAGLKHHFHPLVRKIVLAMEKGTIFNTVKYYSKADTDFDVISKLNEHAFTEQEFGKSASAQDISLFNAEGLIPNIKQHLIEGVDAIGAYPGFALVETTVKERWGSDLSDVMVSLAEQRGGGVVMHALLQKTKIDVDFVSNAILTDFCIWNSNPFPTHIVPHANLSESDQE